MENPHNDVNKNPRQRLVPRELCSPEHGQGSIEFVPAHLARLNKPLNRLASDCAYKTRTLEK